MKRPHIRSRLYKWAENKPLDRKLKIMIGSIFVPLIVMIAALLVMVNYFGISYGNIVNNVTFANRYNLQFEKNMNSAMYQMVARSLHKDELEAVTGEKNPDEQIEELRDAFKELGTSSHSGRSKAITTSILKLLVTLGKRVNDIDDTVTQSGSYDENMQRLDSDIRIITELIQERITEYIYYETESMESLTESLEDMRIRIVNIVIIITFIIAIAMLLYSGAIVESITRPVKRLCDAVEMVGRGDFGARTEVSENNELFVLTDSFNLMTKRIGELVENIKKEQAHSRDMELRLLQSQINPHFLYNTLDNIIWLAEDGRMEDIEYLVTALSQFFRSTLAGGRDFVTIREELTHIEAYLKIQKYRYRDIMNYRIDAAEKYMDYGIPKLTLQLLVENALYHGIKYKRGGGTISIMIEEGVPHHFVITVADDGAGMDEETLAKMRQYADGTLKPMGNNEGFGISTIGERLRISYGLDAGISFESVKGEGTRAYITLPETELPESQTEPSKNPTSET